MAEPLGHNVFRVISEIVLLKKRYSDEKFIARLEKLAKW